MVVIRLARGGDKKNPFYRIVAADKRDRRDGGNFIDSKGQARLFVAKGKSDGLSPKKVIQLLEKKSRVPSHRIQGLEMYDSYSFVNVSFNDAEAILGAFKSSDKRSIVERAK